MEKDFKKQKETQKRARIVVGILLLVLVALIYYIIDTEEKKTQAEETAMMEAKRLHRDKLDREYDAYLAKLAKLEITTAQDASLLVCYLDYRGYEFNVSDRGASIVGKDTSIAYGAGVPYRKKFHRTANTSTFIAYLDNKATDGNSLGLTLLQNEEYKATMGHANNARISSFRNGICTFYKKRTKLPKK